MRVGRENLPVTGISYEDAKAYCAWLSKTTGRTYRLPTAEEAEDLYEGSEADDNTLDRWAGYELNPDDAKRLEPKIRELKPGALLKDVGQAAKGKAVLVFDLGGNVSEWIDGKVLKGGSADRPADAKTRTSDATPEYRGFRVVLDTMKK